MFASSLNYQYREYLQRIKLAKRVREGLAEALSGNKANALVNYWEQVRKGPAVSRFVPVLRPGLFGRRRRVCNNQAKNKLQPTKTS